MDEIDPLHPNIAATMMQSSTHISQVRSSIEASRPGRALFDPLDTVVTALAPHTVAGEGQTLGIITENDRYSIAEFQRMLDRLGIPLAMQEVRLP